MIIGIIEIISNLVGRLSPRSSLVANTTDHLRQVPGYDRRLLQYDRRLLQVA